MPIRIYETEQQRGMRLRERQRENQLQARRDQHEIRIVDTVEVVHQASDNAMRLKKAYENSEKVWKEFTQQYAEFYEKTIYYSIYAITLISLPLATIGIDILIFSPTADFLVKLGFSDMPRLAIAGRFMVPLFVVLAETGLSRPFSQALHDAQEDGKVLTRGVIFWGVLAGMFALMMPIFILSVLWVNQANDELTKDVLQAFTLQQIGLCILSLVLHSAILFAGSHLHTAYEYVAFRFRNHRLIVQYRQEQRQFFNQRDRALAAARQHVREVDAYNRIYHPEPPSQAGPFEPRVARFVNEQQNEFILNLQNPVAVPQNNNQNVEHPAAATPQLPAALQQEQPPAQAQPEPAQEDSDAANEYYRRILQQRINQAEDEVTP